MKYSICILGHSNARRLVNSVQSAIKQTDDVVVVYDAAVIGDVLPAHRRCLEGVTLVLNCLDSFSEQRNLATTRCRHEWVLHLDSDEEISGELGETLAILEPPNDILAFELSRETYVWNLPVRYSFGYDYTSRLYLRTLSWTGDVHERVQVQQSHIATIPYRRGVIRHYTVDTIAQWVDKTMRYIPAESSGRTAIPYRIRGPLRIIYSPIKTYVFRRGFLDGRVGLIVMVLTLIHESVIWIASWESSKESANDGEKLG